jgi:hypothetical protein
MNEERRKEKAETIEKREREGSETRGFDALGLGSRDRGETKRGELRGRRQIPRNVVI